MKNWTHGRSQGSLPLALCPAASWLSSPLWLTPLCLLGMRVSLGLGACPSGLTLHTPGDLTCANAPRMRFFIL